MVYKRPRLKRVRVHKRPAQRLSLRLKKSKIVTMARLLSRRGGIPLRTALRISAKLIGYNKKKRYYRR